MMGLKSLKVQPFKVPKLNFDSDSYVDMIDWTEPIFEPPLTKHLTDDELRLCIETPLDVPNYPCHTQQRQENPNVKVVKVHPVVSEVKWT